MMALPQNIPTSLWELSRLSDEILFIAGDTSVDTSWYTKRAVLSSIYAGAELFMTQDTSSSFEETEAFLNRIVEDAQQVRDAAGMMGTWFGMQGIGLFNMLRSKGVRI